MARILVIDDDFNLLQMIKLMLERAGHTVEIAKDGQRGIRLAAQSQPDLAIVDVMMPGLNGYDVVRQLRQDPATARIPIIILTARSQPMDRRMALEAGANAFLFKPVTSRDLTERIDAVLRAGVGFRVHTGLLTEPVSVPPVTAPQDSAPAAARPAPESRATASTAPADARPPGRLPIGAEHAAQTADVPPARLPVITVISLRGGTGCTTVAVNLALALAQGARQVCLADLSTASGHAHIHLHLKPSHTWSDLLAMGDVPDPRVVSQCVSQVSPSGVAVLCAPIQPAPAALSTPATQNILRELTAAHNPVVVDARDLDSAARGALQVSSAVIVVMADDLPSLQSAHQLLIALRDMGVGEERVRVVLNHVRPTIDLTPDTIEKALKRPLAVEIPYDPNQPGAIRHGVPLVIGKPDSLFAGAIQQLARAVAS